MSRPPVPLFNQNTVTGVYQIARMMNAADVELDDFTAFEGGASTGFPSPAVASAMDFTSSTSSSTSNLGTVSPQDLLVQEPFMSAPNSTAFTSLTSPSIYNESPEFDGFDVSPSFGSVECDGSADPWYPLFPQDSRSGADQSRSLDNSPANKSEDLEESARHTSGGGRKKSTSSPTGSTRHSSVSGVVSRKRDKPLPPIIVEDHHDTVAMKRARNTLAARKSRERKAQRFEDLEERIASSRETVGTERLLKLFAKYDIKTTWFIPGHSLESFPEDMAAPPRGNRGAWWEASADGVRLLLSHGIEYDHSMSHHDTQPYYLPTDTRWTKIDYAQPAQTWMRPLQRGVATGIVEVPANWCLDDLPPLMYMKGVANSHGFVNARDVEDMWRDHFDYLYREHDSFVLPLTLHPDVSGRPHVLLMHERLIEHFSAHEGVRFATMGQVVDEFRRDNAPARGGHDAGCSRGCVEKLKAGPLCAPLSGVVSFSLSLLYVCRRR
ncbi:hypothetical protein G6O67_008315 [Ophiocordyceps sinensis]|uniref:BZIP domain-containing protein n=1 Tax=Ophiocordyceps sinensis TaxID=72228 RepID=A0A8H4PKR5_9HYPO|nr:hypothetical protein G6O67_008315 [Ophiocordyceps sinensis]